MASKILRELIWLLDEADVRTMGQRRVNLVGGRELQILNRSFVLGPTTLSSDRRVLGAVISVEQALRAICRHPLDLLAQVTPGRRPRVISRLTPAAPPHVSAL